MNILALEAYDGGSHKQFLDGLIHASTHHFTRIGLPARKWKWRIRGSAIYFAQELQKLPTKEQTNIDLLFISSMTSAADLRALLPQQLRDKPIIAYFHENQLTYPLESEDLRDYQYGFTHITTCLTANHVWFNSAYNRDSFLTAADNLLKRMPDYIPQGITQTIRDRSSVMPLGLDDDLFNRPLRKQKNEKPTLLWNHRWEYDKNPEDFFQTLFDLHKEGLDFNLIIAGQHFRQSPPIFETAKKILADHIIHFGYAPSRQEYYDLLDHADIVVSTAHHEFFGLAVLEAIARNCLPLLPNRLSYPELIPPACHKTCLYETNDQLRTQVRQWCQSSPPELKNDLAHAAKKYKWSNLIHQYDKAIKKITPPRKGDIPRF